MNFSLCRAAEMDEMWSFVQSKQQQRWLWHAIDHATGKVLAMYFAHEDVAFLELKTLLVWNYPIFSRMDGALINDT